MSGDFLEKHMSSADQEINRILWNTNFITVSTKPPQLHFQKVFIDVANILSLFRISTRKRRENCSPWVATILTD
jgi:hypothetical protein